MMKNKNKNEEDDFQKKNDYIKCLSKTFSKFGGVLAKVSQILNLENEKSNVFADCKPFSKNLTHDFFLEEILTKDEFHNVDIDLLEVFNSGTIGQVYKCKYKNNDIIVKVQYEGLQDQTRQDLNILEKIVSYLYNIENIYEIIQTIKIKIEEEFNYTYELKNINHIRELFNEDVDIIIPNTYEEISSNNYISMDFLKGQLLSTFILNSTQEEKNIVGSKIVKFIFKSMFVFNILYSDCHYGNFLISDNLDLNIIDFGCIHYLDEELVNDIKTLYITLLNNDKYNFFMILEKLNIINESISEESKEYSYEYFMLQFEPLISDDFVFTDEWMIKSTFKNMNLMREWVLPSNMVYFNKIPYGLYHILNKLRLSINIKNIIENYILF